MKRILNRRGQFMIEGILLMVVLCGVILVLTRQIRDNQLVSKMVTEPWKKVAGMTEFGVWSEANKAGQKKHPNTFNRFYTPEK